VQPGTVLFTACFISEQHKADDTIHFYIMAHQRDARKLTVVSSDHQVRSDAHVLDTKVLSAVMFADILVISIRNRDGEKTGWQISS
jgi:hypothetical protein